MEVELFNKTLDEIERVSTRRGIIEFEKILEQVEGATTGDCVDMPLKHTFSDGIYVREIKIPAGSFLTGKIHKHDHPNFLMEGEVKVVTEQGGEEYLKAPRSIISPPGTKRALYAVTDLVWITVHSNPTNTQDLKELEEIVIADTFETYSKFVISKEKPMRKLKNFIMKKLIF